MSSFNLHYKSSPNLRLQDSRNLTFKTTGGLAFQYFWSVKDRRIKIVLVLCLSVCSGCLNFFFVERAAIYNPGLFAVWQAIARCVKSFMKSNSHDDIVYILLFWVLNSVMNLILAVATYRVIGREMTKLSVLFIVGSALTGIGLSKLPETWGLKSFYLFSNPFGTEGCTDKAVATTASKVVADVANQNHNFLVWESNMNCTNSSKNGIIVLFLYAIVFSALNALIASLLYALGGCGGGVDWIIFYLFKTKSYFATKLIFYTGIAFLSFSYLTGSYIPWAVKSANGSGTGNTSTDKLVSNFFSPLFFALLSSIFVRRFIFNVFYPRFKLINVKIFTNKFLEIRNELIRIKFPHSFTIVPSFGSYSLRSQAQLEFVCLLVELQELVQVIRKIDQNCFICSLPVRFLDARIHLRSRNV